MNTLVESLAVGGGWSMENRAGQEPYLWYAGAIITPEGIIYTHREEKLSIAWFVHGGRLHKLVISERLTNAQLVRRARKFARQIVAGGKK